MSVSRRVFRRKQHQPIKLSADEDIEVSSVEPDLSSDEEITDSDIKMNKKTKPTLNDKVHKKKSTKKKLIKKSKPASESEDEKSTKKTSTKKKLIKKSKTANESEDEKSTKKTVTKKKLIKKSKTANESESEDESESESEDKTTSITKHKKKKRTIFRIPKLNTKQQNKINKIVGHDNLLVYYEKNEKGTFNSTLHSMLRKCLGYNKEKRDNIIAQICDKTECFEVNRHIKYLIINKNEKRRLINA